MLILTRWIGESILIDNTIKITILDITGKQVRIGILAPPNVSIHREEIQERINRGRLVLKNKLKSIILSLINVIKVICDEEKLEYSEILQLISEITVQILDYYGQNSLSISLALHERKELQNRKIYIEH